MVTAVEPAGNERAWPKPPRTRLAGVRQVVETAIERLLEAHRLDRARPHGLDGFQARLAAKVARYSTCLRLNRSLGRSDLAFADLVDWEEERATRAKR